MTPISAITKEVKSKTGKNIIVTIEAFNEPIGNITTAEKFYTLETFIDKKTKNFIGRLLFPKMTSEEINKQIDITVSNIDGYLDAISKG